MKRNLLITAICAALSMFFATSLFAGNYDKVKKDVNNIHEPGLKICNGQDAQFKKYCKQNSLFCERLDNLKMFVCGGAGAIYVSASAGGRLIDLLGDDFDLIPIGGSTSSPFFLRPMVVAAADLDNPDIAKLLRLSYDAGWTVAIASATIQDADRFTRFFNAGDAASCTADNSVSNIVMYGIQKSLDRRPPLNSSYCLKGLGAPDKKGDKLVRLWLIERFGTSPPEPLAGNVSDSSSVNLADLSSQTHCSYLDTDDPDNLDRQMQLDSYVLSVRSFDNQQDLYLVNNQVQYQQGTSKNPVYNFEIQRFGASGVQNIDAEVDFTEPDTQSVTTSYTNSESETVSGSVGFNETDGFNASVGASVTVGQSTTVTLPPVLITNQTTLSPPFPKWTFEPTSPSSGQLFSAQANWVWSVDMASYGQDMGEGSTGTISFVSAMVAGDFAAQPLCATAPYPFPAWTVTAPQIISVNPTSVERGGYTFTITGTQFYPNLVTAVLLGGNALPTSNYSTQSDTSIVVTVPSSQPTGNSPVQVETNFNGQTLDSNNDVTVDITK
jgi:hypothetical protein